MDVASFRTVEHSVRNDSLDGDTKYEAFWSLMVPLGLGCNEDDDVKHKFYL